MKQTPFSVFCIKLFLGSVFGIFVCFCIDRILNIQQANFWQSLFMAVAYLFMYCIFPYYVASSQANQDRKILRYKEHYPEEISYSLASLRQPYKGLKAGFIAMIPHMLTTIIPFLTFFGVTENINSIYNLINIHLREFIDFACSSWYQRDLAGAVLPDRLSIRSAVDQPFWLLYHFSGNSGRAQYSL